MSTEEKKEEEALRRELAALSWVGRIRDALDEDRLVLYSQPIVPLGHASPCRGDCSCAWWTATAR